ncbi:hypothetical protein [uncultured Thiodictyon sp.]|uniref:hypothetical protein n=1 Tax=uncultured Thiodictyon sp. TaxID=1846217 RepID=UPI0025FDAFBD|nr:hypothetical protein [uncultured Thiodictyon sp.]
MFEPAVTGPVTLPRIEREVFALRQRLDAAAQTLSDYESQVAPIRDAFAPQIRRHAAEIAAVKVDLIKLIAAGRGLFAKPKSRTIHGVKVGLRKEPDRYAWPADDALVATIKQLCTPEEQKAYLVTTTVGRKDAIPADARKRLGIGCTPGTDAVLVDELATGTGAALLALLAQLPVPAEEAA